MTTNYVQEVFHGIVGQLDDRYVFGARRHLELLAIGFLCGGHVLIEGPPGTGKTRTAKLFAQILARSFQRIQFTSDLLPADIIGAPLYSQKNETFTFVKGAIFADFILADEVNRAPPRTQSALLEAMEERQITSEGKRYPLSSDFFVVATQNPQDLEGTFPLPEAQIDRFMLKLTATHVEPLAEQQILARSLAGALAPPPDALTPVAFDRTRLEAQMRQVVCDDSLLRYVTLLLAATRKHPMLTWGSSVRGGMALLAAARLNAAAQGRAFVTPDDLKELAVPVLAHRLRLTPEAEVGGATAAAIIASILTQTAFPA